MPGSPSPHAPAHPVLTFGSAAAAGAGAGGAGGAGGSCLAGTSAAGACGEPRTRGEHGAGAWPRGGGRGAYLKPCRWDAGPGGGCGCDGGGGAGAAPKKARKPPAGDIICPTLPCSSLGLTEGSGLPTRPETRANWLGDIRPAWRSGGSTNQPGGETARAGWPWPAQGWLLWSCEEEDRTPAGGAERGNEQGDTWAPPSSCALCRWVRTGETLWGNGWPSREEFWGEKKGAGPPVTALAQRHSQGARNGHGEERGASQYRYVAELVGGHPLAVGSGVALLHAGPDVDWLRAQDLGTGRRRASAAGSSHSSPQPPPAPRAVPAG